ncbi:MAG: hypothetical protein ABIR18_11175 [Chitinophagaceae bacterium]
MVNRKQNNWFVLAPSIGICLFILLYTIATFFYPGGSDIDKTAVGFSWVHNYWCELLAEQSPNSQVNTARPIAISAMVVLVISLSLFWFYASRLFRFNSFGKAVILYTGVGSMITTVFLSTVFHDTIINISGALGCIAIIVSLIALYKMRAYKLFYLGIFCLVLCIINNYIYHTGHFFSQLAVIQKITFFFFLLWFCCVDILLYRQVVKVESRNFIS